MKMYVADPLVAKLEAERHKLAMRGHLAAEHHVVEHALKIVQAEPTVDAEPVVRCRNCISFGKQPEYLRGVIRPDTGLCMYTGKLVLPDDFCSNAVEIDGGAEDGST